MTNKERITFAIAVLDKFNMYSPEASVRISEALHREVEQCQVELAHVLDAIKEDE